MNYKLTLSVTLSRALLIISLIATQTLFIQAVNNASLTGKNGTIATTLTSLKPLPLSDRYTKALDLLASGALVQQAAAIIGKAIADSPKLTKTFTHMKQLLATADHLINNKNALTSAAVKLFTNAIVLLDADKKALSNEYYLLDADKRTAKNTFYELMPLLLTINTILVAQSENNAPTGASTSAATQPATSKPTTSVPAVKVQPKPATKQESNVAKPTSSVKPALDLEAQKTQLDYEMQTTSTAINRNLVKIQDGKKVDFNQLKNELNQWKKLTATANAGPLSFVGQHTKNKDLLSIVAECKEINNTLIAHIQNIIDFKLDPSFDINEEKENEAKQALLVKIENIDPEKSIQKITPKSFKTKAEEAAYYIAHAFSIRLTTLVENVALIREFPE